MNVVPIEGRRRAKPPHKRNQALSHERLVEVVSVVPSTGVRLVKVHFVWPCFNCKRTLHVNRDTFQQLESRVLLGIKCHTCLDPKPSLSGVREWLAA